MKQLLIGTVLSTTAGDAKDLTGLGKGELLVYNPSTNALIGTNAKVAVDFAIALGRGADKPAFLIPEVDVKTLQVAKASYAAPVTYTSKFIVPTPTADKDYTLMLVKKGTHFNERAIFTHTFRSKSTSADDVAQGLADSINANSVASGVTATISTADHSVTLLASESGKDYAVKFGDELSGVTLSTSTQGTKGILDAEYIKELAKDCAAGKGFNLLADDGKELYPGLDNDIIEMGTEVNEYTLRYATTRKASKQTDTPVYQRVHLVVSSAVADTLDTIFGLS